MKTSNKVEYRPFAKMGLSAGAVLALAIITAVPASAANNFVKFEMVRSPALSAFPLFVPQAHGIVQITSVGPVEIMDVFFSGLPPNTGFDFFVIQAPNSPFGLSWYQGDIETNSRGLHLNSSLAALILRLLLSLLESLPLPLYSDHRIRAWRKIP